MITIIGLVGLMVFSGFEGLSGLGRAKSVDLSSEEVQAHGPTAYGVLMTTTCLMGLITYLRLRIALGSFSLMIDPQDRPYRPFRLTDSLLGYMLIAFLLSLSLHVLLYPHLKNYGPSLLLIIDSSVFVLAVVVEQLALILAGQKTKH